MEKLIVECVVRSLLIAVCTAAALFVLRVKAARVRHAVWASVVALMLLLPIETAWGPKAVLRVMKPEPAVVYTQPTGVQQAVPDPDGPALPQRSEPWTLKNALLAAYLLGFCALMARLITGTVRVRKLTRESCAAPITVGWLKPTVILPANADQWPPEQLNAVLIHEDEHARHRDPMVQWLALLNRAIFWFHPLAWWLERKLSALAEEACDDAVLTQGQDPVQYSEYLLDFARTMQQAGGMAMARTFLPQRIKRIAMGTKPQQISRMRIVTLALTVTAISAVFTAGAVGRTPTSAANALVGPVEAEPVLNPEPVLLAEATPRPAPKRAHEPAAAPMQAQSLTCTVADPSGAIVPNAPLTLTNTTTGATSSAVTNGQGICPFQDIPPGTYNLQIKTPGFKTLTQNNIQVAAGETHNAGNMLLQVGSISESISITESRSAAASRPPAQPDPFIKTLGPVTVLMQAATPAPAPPPQLRPRPQAVPGGPIPVGGNVQASKIISQTKPVYPQDALQEGVGGTVKVEAVVTKEGTLSGVTLINSPDPRLTQAALDAIKQWRYQPTLLNGDPIEVITTIDVNYESVN